MRIIHFSDIHSGCCPRTPSFLFDKRLLGSLNFYLRRRNVFKPEFVSRAVSQIKIMVPDLVICTGDLTSVGSPEEFDVALAALKPLLDHFGERFLYVPGNHDTYVRDHRCRAGLEAAFATLNSGRWTLAEMPQELVLQHLHLFLLNECQPTNWLLSCGKLSEVAHARLTQWLAKEKGAREKRVLVGHFPLRDPSGHPLHWRRRLNGSNFLANALKQGQLDLSLCGHDHQPSLRRYENDAMEICAGSLTQHGRINVVDYSPQTGRFKQFWVDLFLDKTPPLPIANALVTAVD